MFSSQNFQRTSAILVALIGVRATAKRIPARVPGTRTNVNEEVMSSEVNGLEKSAMSAASSKTASCFPVQRVSRIVDSGYAAECRVLRRNRTGEDAGANGGGGITTVLTAL